MEARLQRRRSCRNATFSLIAILLIVKTAASSCPPPEEQSLSDVHCPREIHTTQEALDLCYMKLATGFAIETIARHPIQGHFAAVLVHQKTNAMVCMGVNRNDINPMRHGETSLFQNCTETYPSPSGDNYRDPCLDYSQYTMYTTGEPCPMCASATAYYGVTRVVQGTQTNRLICLGYDVPMFDSSFVNEKSAHLYPNGKPAEIIKGVYTDVLDPLFASALGKTLPEGWPESCPPLPSICPETTAGPHTCNDPSHQHAEL